MNPSEILDAAKKCIEAGGELYSIVIGKEISLFGQKLLIILDPDMERGKMLFLNRHDTIELINLKDEDYESDYDFPSDEDL